MQIKAWRRWASSRGLSEQTLVAYERELRRLSEALTIEPDRAAARDLRAVLEASEGSPSTVNRRVAAWASYYRWLVRAELRDDDPTQALDRPKVRRGLPRPVDDLDAALARLPLRFQPIAVLLAETGLRISEALAVDVGADIPEALIVRGKGQKERWVPLSDLARAALTELGGRVPFSARRIQAVFKQAGFSPHRLRHHFASALAEQGEDVAVISDLLGHASVQTTMIYTRISRRRLRDAVERKAHAE